MIPVLYSLPHPPSSNILPSANLISPPPATTHLLTSFNPKISSDQTPHLPKNKVSPPSPLSTTPQCAEQPTTSAPAPTTQLLILARASTPAGSAASAPATPQATSRTTAAGKSAAVSAVSARVRRRRSRGCAARCGRRRGGCVLSLVGVRLRLRARAQVGVLVLVLGTVPVLIRRRVLSTM